MNEIEDFPYRAEYAKSGRSTCKKCQSNIAQDSLRMAVMVQSPAFDGKIPRWHHFHCFFHTQRPKAVQDIAHFDSLRFADQEKIKERISQSGAGAPKGKEKGKAKGGKKGGRGGISDFNIEVAKSGRAACRGCEEKILKDEIRISKLDYDDDKAKRFGPIPRWHHVDCFIEKRSQLEYYEAGEDLPGFNTLSAENKKLIREKIKKTDAPKRKAEEDSVDGTSMKKPKVEENSELVEKQNKKMFYFRDHLQKNLKKSEMAELVEYNDYPVPSGESNILDLLADLMTFGVCLPCKVCNTGYFVFKSGIGYKCHGDITEWTKCTNVVDAPKRKPFQVPESFKEEFTFLKKYKFKDYGPRHLVKRVIGNGQSAKEEKSRRIPPLTGMSVVIHSDDFKKSVTDMEFRVKRLGGAVQKKVGKNTTFLITTKTFMDSEHTFLEAAEKYGVHCVPEDFLDELQMEGASMMIEKKNMATWAKDVSGRVKVLKSMSMSNGESSSLKSIPHKLKIKLKGGAAVDPDSGKEESCHVYQRNGKNYNAVLGLVDLNRGTNSYYKLQLLEHSTKRKYYVFRSWGRIGTEIGGNKLESMEGLIDALHHFDSLYEDKTGNKFEDSNFVKIPGKFYPLELDYGEEKEEMKKLDVKGSKSKLPLAVQKFVSTICDVDTMKNALIEYEIDLKKMPLGKLSRRQLEQAYGILSDALKLVTELEVKQEVKPTEEELAERASNARVKLLDCSNRFYTLIPHDFGMNNPPLLDNQEIIKSKIEMIDGLREIEVSYNVLKSEDDKESKKSDPIDRQYKKLKTKMDVLPKESEEFKIIKEYVSNTHAATHSHYKLEVDEVFIMEREGEKRRFKPFKKLHNHKLLWHGSRVTNYVGILSQGLRIAPPEAPVTGYMFGKGIYFADMVSKSANYCMTSKTNNTGMLLLCDTALGEMYERCHAEYVEKLPVGKHSCKGLGMTCPDPEKDVTLADGLKVPLGKGVKSGVQNTSLLYNEYIVYDVAQVNVRYLVQVKFIYNI